MKKTKRPWGTYTVLSEGEGYKVKLVEVSSHKRLSLQKHKFRSEHWIIVEGQAEVVNGEKEYILVKSEQTFIVKEVLHRIKNSTDTPLKIIEVQCGSYLGEDDIERFEDDHGRVTVVNYKKEI